MKLINFGMKIKVKIFNDGCLPKIINKGEWIDLYSAENVELKAPRSTKQGIMFSTKVIPLGVGMKLPEGFEAIIAPRSSTFKSFGIIQSNMIGIIDNSYSGNEDQWKYPVIAIKEGIIREGEKIAQFRIQLSQKATIWQKIKWLFSNKIEIEIVDKLKGPNRGGFGTTGKK